MLRGVSWVAGAGLAALVAAVRSKLAGWRGGAGLTQEDKSDFVAALDLHVMSVLVSSSLSSLAVPGTPPHLGGRHSERDGE
jgi:hypothetical protein